MRHLVWWPLSVLLLLAGSAAAAQVPDSNQNAQPLASPRGDSATPADANKAPGIKPQVTVTAPSAEGPLPALPPNQFTDCTHTYGKATTLQGGLQALMLCQVDLSRDRYIVIERCINPGGDHGPSVVIQACTELLNPSIFEHWMWFFVYANRAAAYVAQGDKQHALDDYNEAVKLAPHNADLYYNRGVFYAAQSDDDAALRDFDKALGLNSRLVPALRQRARIYQTRGNFSGALADYSQAIGLQPKTAALWSERGYVCLRQRDYGSTIRDEAQAIQLDPKLARAYFLRGVAFGDLGDSRNASTDIKTAVGLDPSLAHYVMIRGKTASLALPPP